MNLFNMALDLRPMLEERFTEWVKERQASMPSRQGETFRWPPTMVLVNEDGTLHDFVALDFGDRSVGAVAGISATTGADLGREHSQCENIVALGTIAEMQYLPLGSRDGSEKLYTTANENPAASPHMKVALCTTGDPDTMDRISVAWPITRDRHGIPTVAGDIEVDTSAYDMEPTEDGDSMKLVDPMAYACLVGREAFWIARKLVGGSGLLDSLNLRGLGLEGLENE